jgi:hypothetical protein
MGQREKGRGYRQNALLLPPFDPKQKGGTTWRPAGRALAGGPMLGDGRKLGKTERVAREIDPHAHLVLVLLAGAAPRAGQTGDGDVRDSGAPVCKREESLVVVVRGGPGSGRPLFIGGVRWFGRPIFRARGASMAGNGGSGNIPAWTPAGGIRGQSSVVGLDPSCRRAGHGRGGGSGDAVRWCWRGRLGQSL